MKNGWIALALVVFIILLTTFLHSVGLFGWGSGFSSGGIMGNFTPKPLPEDSHQRKRVLQKIERELKKLQPQKSYIVINTHANRLYIRREKEILFEAICSTGYGGSIADSATGRKWIFDTPKGVFTINSKLVEPWWKKPDWAYLEEDKEIPKDARERYDPYMLGDYALGFGNGYFIHGTLYERLLGISVTHGCIRLGSADLKYLYDHVQIGTSLYIF